MTDSTELIELDPRVADLLRVPVRVAKDTLAQSVAHQAGFSEPTTQTLVQFWVTVATCIDAELVKRGIAVRDDGEAAHEVRSCVFEQLGGLDGDSRVLDELGKGSLDDALEPWLMRDIVQGMAARGAYRLVGRPIYPPPE
ncbi:MAG: hypothetical protein U0T02_08160 [Solirubrobacteraceae bacterium]